MKIRYSVTITISTDPEYSLICRVVPASIEVGDSSRLSFNIENTNSVSSSSGNATIKLSNSNATFTDGTTSSTVVISGIVADGTYSGNVTLIGQSEGTVTVTVSYGGYSVSCTLTVMAKVNPALYQCTVSNPLNMFVGGIVTVTAVFTNTNNTEGTLSLSTITTTGNIKIVSGSALITSTSWSSEVIPAGGSVTKTLQLKGVSAGSDTLKIVNDDIGTVSKNITVLSAPALSTDLSRNSFIKNKAQSLSIMLENTGSTSIEFSTVNLTVTSGFVFSNGTDTIDLPFTEPDVQPYTSESVKTTVTGSILGAGTLTVSIPEINYSCAFNISCIEEAEYSKVYDISADECTVGEQLTITRTVTNTNNASGTCTSESFNLPTGVTTLDGYSTYTFPSVSIPAGGSVTQTINIVTNTTGTKAFNVGNELFIVVVNDVPVVSNPQFNSNWAYLTKTELNPSDTSQLVVQYDVINNVYPATVPLTSIVISGSSVRFTDGSTSKTINQQTLNTDETFTNITDNPLYLEFVSDGTSTITITNELLGSKTFTVQCDYVGAIFNTSLSVVPAKVTHTTGGAIITATLTVSNSGDMSGVYNGTTFSLTGDCLTFDDETTVKVTADTNIGVGETIKQVIQIRTVEYGTGTLRVTNNTNNFNQTLTLYSEEPSEPEYSYNIYVTVPSVPVWSDTEQVSSEIKVEIHNTNYKAGETPTLICYLDDELSFIDGTSSIELQPIQLDRNGKTTYTITKQVKGLKVGTHAIILGLSDEASELCYCTLQVVGATPVNLGHVNIEECYFLENSASVGGALCNYGKYYNTNNIFKDNTASVKCPMIYDNGVCK